MDNSGMELQVKSAQEGVRSVPLATDRITLGRAADNDLAYPEDSLLSRHHLVLEREGPLWWVQDLRSKNGTQVNGEWLTTRRVLQPGDTVSAGQITLIYRPPGPKSPTTVQFVDEAPQTASTYSTSLFQATAASDTALHKAIGDVAPESLHRLEALILAGRELAGHRPLEELFDVILDLSVRSVGARRGLLATLENGGLSVAAARGEGFRISSVVRDRVLKERASLLILDAMQDARLKSTNTIIEQAVRSLMAVPLQTDDRVIGLIYVDSPETVPFSSEDLHLLTVMANIAAVRIEHARLMEIEQAERLMAHEVEQAAEIQKRLLPRLPPQMQGVELAGHSVSCHAVGGDYYDFVVYPNGHIALVVADVAGKGLPASLMMTSLHASVRVLLEEHEDLDVIVTRLNSFVAATCPQNRFITFFIAVLNPETGELNYCNAGHNPALIVRDTGEVEKLASGGPVLGVLKTMKYHAQKAWLERGDVLLMYSDGVTEATNPRNEEYGEQRLVELAVAVRLNAAPAILDAVRTSVTNFLGGTPADDDITVVVAKAG